MALFATFTGLLVAFTAGIYGQENTEFYLRGRGDGFYFESPKEANFCVISRYVGEEQLVLWNTSDPSPENSTLPEDLKRRLSVSTSYYKLNNLTESDSGLYETECWTNRNKTHQEQHTVTVCGIRTDREVSYDTVGKTVELTCEGEREGGEQRVQWFTYHQNHGFQKLFMDDGSVNPEMKFMEGRIQMIKNNSALRISNITHRDIRDYRCLIMYGKMCESSKTFYLRPKYQFIHHFVGQKAVLSCSDTNLSGIWSGNNQIYRPQNVSNVTDQQRQSKLSEDPVENGTHLVFSALTENHTGDYYCLDDNKSVLSSYVLLVCPPEFTTTTEFLSNGDEVTLSCNYSLSEDEFTVWMRKTDLKDGLMFLPMFLGQHSEVNDDLKDRVNVSLLHTTLVLSNFSSEDSGEYICVVVSTRSRALCKSTAKIILMSKEPFGISSAFYAAWSSLMSWVY